MTKTNFGRGNNDGKQGAVDLSTAQASADTHMHSDLNSGPRAQHHSLGDGVNQAFSGKRGKTVEDLANSLNTDVGDLLNFWKAQQNFVEDFSDPDSLARWNQNLGLRPTDGSWTLPQPVDSEFGRNVFQATDAYHVAYNYGQLIPFDPTALYRIRVRCRGLSGAPRIYAGVRPMGVNNTNVPGALPSGNCYCAAINELVPIGSDWVEYVGYLKGLSVNGGYIPGTVDNPGSLPIGTMTMAPLMLPLVSGGVGDSMQISLFQIEKLSPQVRGWKFTLSASFDSAVVAPAAYVDVGDLQGNIVVDSAEDQFLVSMNIDCQKITNAVNTTPVYKVVIGASEALFVPAVFTVAAGGSFRMPMSATAVVTGLTPGTQLAKVMFRNSGGTDTMRAYSGSKLSIVRLN